MSITAPTDIASCILWLDSEMGRTPSTGRITQWDDQSGHGNHFTNGSGSGFTVAVADYNGHDTLKGGFSDYMVGPNLFSGATVGEAILFGRCLFDPPGTSDQTRMWSFGTSGQESHYPWVSGDVYDDWGSTTRQATGNPTLDLSTAFRTYDVLSKAGEWTSRIDGSVHYTTATNTVGFSSTPALGRRVGGGVGWDGRYAGVYMFNAELTSTERSDMLAYIANRFAAAPSGGGNTFRVGGFIG